MKPMLLPVLLLLFLKSAKSIQVQTQLHVVSEPQCTQLLDVIAVVDGSETIADEEFIKLKMALIHLADGLDLRQDGQRFGAVVYSAVVSETAPLNDNFDELEEEITAFHHPKQGTLTHLGIESMTGMMKENGRRGVPQVGIVVTDGQSYNRTATEIAASEAKNIGIKMFAVGVGRYIDTSELYSIASRDENVLALTDFDELLASITSLIKKVCIVNGGWSEWSVVNTTACTVSCGEGSTISVSKRTCTNPAPENGGNDCEGPAVKTVTDTCKENDCPTHGGWSAWSSLTKTECSASCGGGSRTCTLTRTCTEPVPAHGGEECEGSNTQNYTEECNTVSCPVNGGWSEWSTPTKSECSASCGGGSRTSTLTRTCTNPSPAYGGEGCEGSNTQNYTEACNTVSCTGSSSLCERCEYLNGVGYNPYPTDCSKYVHCIENGEDFVMNCAPGLEWNQEHLICTLPSQSTCHSGATSTATFKTTTEGVALPCNGKMKDVPDNKDIYLEYVLGHGWMRRDCAQGSIFDIRVCGCSLKPVNGGWSEWFVLTKDECSASCGGGYRNCTKTRTCTNPVPAHGGQACTGHDSEEYTETCNTKECPVHGGWSEWSNGTKTVCSATCGEGSRTCTLTRTCTNPSPAHGGLNCTGHAQHQYTENCNMEPCDGKTTCKRYGVEGNNNVYLQFVAGFGNMTLSCAPGTVFESSVCECVNPAVVTVPADDTTPVTEATTPVKVTTQVNEVTAPVSTDCTPELYLPFDSNCDDKSGYSLYVHNENVRIGEGYASFTENSGLRIPRFSNMEFQKTLFISFLLNPGQTTYRDQAIVSNADCGREGSIYIIQKSEKIEFLVRNKAGEPNSLTLPCGAPQNTDRVYRSTPQIKVRLIVSGGIMEVTVGEKTESTQFLGEIAKSHCALQIGRGTGYDNFIGDLDELMVSLCVPEY